MVAEANVDAEIEVAKIIKVIKCHHIIGWYKSNQSANIRRTQVVMNDDIRITFHFTMLHEMNERCEPHGIS